MSHHDETASRPEGRVPIGYEAPRLTPAELECEVLYAGEPTADQDGG